MNIETISLIGIGVGLFSLALAIVILLVHFRSAAAWQIYSIELLVTDSAGRQVVHEVYQADQKALQSFMQAIEKAATRQKRAQAAF